MAPLKEQISPSLAKDLATELRRAHPDFPSPRFTRGVAAALEPLELLARVDVLAARLASTLPSRFPEAAGVLHRSLESPTFTGWMTFPCTTFVAQQGLEHPDVALPLLAALTPRWSSEFAVRPFIERHPELTYRFLEQWCDHEDEHVRRLVSEGTRPRLPWAPVLRGLVADPTPNVPLLDALVDDPSPYVRRSVSNHLNDISRDHPALALDVATRWAARPEAAPVVRHGLRTLIKRGDPGALALIGAGTAAGVELVELATDRPSVTIGESVTFTCTLQLGADVVDPCEAVIDYRVHYAGVRGTKAPKVFKLTRRRLEPGQPVTITRRHAFEHVSIRRIHPGPHRIDVQVNGAVIGSIEIEVVDPT